MYQSTLLSHGFRPEACGSMSPRELECTLVGWSQALRFRAHTARAHREPDWPYHFRAAHHFIEAARAVRRGEFSL